METIGLICVGLVILAGIVLSLFLPGPLLCLGAVIVWAAFTGGTLAWTVVGASVVAVAVGAVAKYLVPGRHLQRSGVPKKTLFAGVLLAIPGFFIVPIVGLFLGFVLGVYLAELARLGSQRAWPSAMQALKAVGLSALIESGTGALIGAMWLGVVIFG